MTDGGRRGDSKYRSAAAPSRGLAQTGKPPYSAGGACADLCQQLLFKGNVDQVVIRDHSEQGAKVVTKIGTPGRVLSFWNTPGRCRPSGHGPSDDFGSDDAPALFPALARGYAVAERASSEARGVPRFAAALIARVSVSRLPI